MKRLLGNTLLAAAMLVVSACGSKEGPADGGPDVEEPVVGITSGESIDVGQEGGTFTVEFEVTNPVEGVQARLVTDAEWIVAGESEGDGSIGFEVAANGTELMRSALIYLVYDWSDTEEPARDSLVVDQEARINEVRHECKSVRGWFYGDLYTDSGEQMYCIDISTLGFEEDSAGAHYAYYKIALFSDKAYDDVDDIQLPDGIYNIGEPGATEIGTFSPDESRYFTSGSDSTGCGAVIGGSLSVSTEGGQKLIEGVLETEDGYTHYIHYCGETDIELYNAGYKPADFDYKVKEGLLGGISHIHGSGDLMLVRLLGLEKSSESEPQAFYYFDLYSPADTSGIVPGTYTVSDSREAFTVLPGRIADIGLGGYFERSYVLIDLGYMDFAAAYITGGTMTFEKDGDNYIVDMDLVTNYGRKFEFHYEGEVEVPLV